jgi:alginate O-acetyltransferase complex protein AlgI
MAAQYYARPPVAFWRSHVPQGLFLFSLGLFKKSILGDTSGYFSDPVFDSASSIDITWLEAWIAAVAYSMQIYFDFSGYSDMAAGMARLFGYRLPLNFYSPYKSASIIDFWQRWHITLSAFLRTYLYIPLGGARRGPLRRYINIFLVMLIGGLWHGAAWTFVAWGGLHGLFISINHLWRAAVGPDRLPRVVSQGLTFLGVLSAWLFFRAADVHTAIAILGAMWGGNGLSLSQAVAGNIPRWLASLLSVHYDGALKNHVVPDPYWALGWLVFVSAVAFLLPNSQELMSRVRPMILPARYLRASAPGSLLWRPNMLWGAVGGGLFMIVILGMGTPTTFIYWMF